MFAIFGGLEFSSKGLEHLVHSLGENFVPLLVSLGIGDLGCVLIIFIIILHLDVLQRGNVLANGREVLRGLISR